MRVPIPPAYQDDMARHMSYVQISEDNSSGTRTGSTVPKRDPDELEAERRKLAAGSLDSQYAHQRYMDWLREHRPDYLQSRNQENARRTRPQPQPQPQPQRQAPPPAEILHRDIFWAAKQGDANAVKSILSRATPSNVFIHSQGAFNAFWTACAHGHTDVIRMMAEEAGPHSCRFIAGAELRWGRNQTSPIWMAVQGRHTEAVRELLSRGASVYTWDLNGRTPLMVTAENGDDEICRMLLKRESAVEKRDTRTGRTALKTATDAGKEEVAGVLREYIGTFRKCGCCDCRHVYSEIELEEENGEERPILCRGGCTNRCCGWVDNGGAGEDGNDQKQEGEDGQDKKEGKEKEEEVGLGTSCPCYAYMCPLQILACGGQMMPGRSSVPQAQAQAPPPKLERHSPAEDQA